MKLSFDTVMKVYNFFSILFFIFGSIAVVMGGPSFLKGYQWEDPAVQSAVVIFRVVIIILFGTGFVVSSLLLLVARKRGTVVYKRIIDRISSNRSSKFNLNIKFPEQDEFGNLGRWLNKFIEQLREFDRIKVERMRVSQQKFSFLSEEINRALVVIDHENRISHVNSKFTELLNIGNRSIVGLPVDSVIENEKLMEALEQVKQKPKNQVLEDLKIKSDNGTYKTRAALVPVLTSEVSVMETMIIFDYIQKKVLPI